MEKTNFNLFRLEKSIKKIIFQGGMQDGNRAKNGVLLLSVLRKDNF